EVSDRWPMCGGLTFKLQRPAASPRPMQSAMVGRRSAASNCSVAGWAALRERPLPDLFAGNDRKATLDFDRTMLQEALQNRCRLLGSDRDEAEKHDTAWRRVPSSVNQFSKVTIEGDQQPTFYASLLEDQYVGCTP